MNLIGLGTFGTTWIERYTERHRAPVALASASISDLKEFDRNKCLKIEISDDTSKRDFKMGLVRDWVDHSLDMTDGMSVALLNPTTEYGTLAAHAFERIRQYQPDAFLCAVLLLPYMKEYPMPAKRNLIATMVDMKETADMVVVLEEERLTSKVKAADQHTAFERMDTFVQYMLDILRGLNGTYGMRQYLASDGLTGELCVPSFAESLQGMDLNTAILQNVCASDFSLTDNSFSYVCMPREPPGVIPRVRPFVAPTPDYELFALTFRPRYQKIYNYFMEVRAGADQEARKAVSLEADLMGELEDVRFGERAAPKKKTLEEDLFG